MKLYCYVADDFLQDIEQDFKDGEKFFGNKTRKEIDKEYLGDYDEYRFNRKRLKFYPACC